MFLHWYSPLDKVHGPVHKVTDLAEYLAIPQMLGICRIFCPLAYWIFSQLSSFFGKIFPRILCLFESDCQLYDVHLKFMLLLLGKTQPHGHDVL